MGSFLPGSTAKITFLLGHFHASLCQLWRSSSISAIHRIHSECSDDKNITWKKILGTDSRPRPAKCCKMCWKKAPPEPRECVRLATIVLHAKILQHCILTVLQSGINNKLPSLFLLFYNNANISKKAYSTPIKT